MSLDVVGSFVKRLVSVFFGCAVIPIKTLSIDFQGRFIDETAFTVKAVYKF